MLRVVRLSEHARLPKRVDEGAAGYDLVAARHVVIPPWGRACILTDLAMTVPVGTYGRIAPRSGLAVKHGITTGGGVIDRSYTGNVGVILLNLNREPFTVDLGMRIAQLIVERIRLPPVEECWELTDTARGTSGFGSTG